MFVITSYSIHYTKLYDAQIVDMVRSAGLIQNQVPVQIALCPLVQVTDHITAIVLAIRPAAELGSAFLATFCEEQMLIRE